MHNNEQKTTYCLNIWVFAIVYNIYIKEHLICFKGGKPTGVLCGEPSAPLRRCTAQPANQSNTTVENNVPVVRYGDKFITE